MKIWKEKQIWELDFETTSDSEDNDSDDDETLLRKKQFEKIREKELVMLKTNNIEAPNRLLENINKLKIDI